MTDTRITPENTWALVVAVEAYPLTPRLDLDGPFHDACRFARWLRRCDVPARHISLLASPLRKNDSVCRDLAAEGVDCQLDKPVTIEALEATLIRFRKKPKMLLVFWSGHGIMTKHGVRRPLLSNYSDPDKHTLNVDSFRQHLRSAMYEYGTEQMFIFDICGTRFDELWHRQALPDGMFSYNVEAPRCRQFVLFASEDGQAAENVTAERTGLYYRELQTILDRLTSWPPDPDAIHAALRERFAKLQREGQAAQSPIRLVWESPTGDRVEKNILPNTSTPSSWSPTPDGLISIEGWKKKFKREFNILTQLEETPLSGRIVDAWTGGRRHFLITGGIASGKSTTAYLVLQKLAALGHIHKDKLRVLQFTRGIEVRYKNELAEWMTGLVNDPQACLLIDDAHDGVASNENWLPKLTGSLNSLTVIVTTRQHRCADVQRGLAAFLSLKPDEYATEPEFVAAQLTKSVVSDGMPRATVFREQALDLFRHASRSLLVLSIALAEWKRKPEREIVMNLAASAIRHELELRTEGVRGQLDKLTAEALLSLIWITGGLEQVVRPDVYEMYFGLSVPRSFWMALVDSGELMEVESSPRPAYRSSRHPSWGQFVSKVADESPLFNLIRSDIVGRFLKLAPERREFRATQTGDDWGCISTLIFAIIQSEVTDIREMSLYCSGTHFHDEFTDAARQLLFVMQARNEPRSRLGSIRLEIATNARRVSPDSMDQREQDLTDCLDLVQTAIADFKHAARREDSFIRTGFAAYELGYIQFLRGSYIQARKAFRESARQDRALGSERVEYAIMSEIQGAFCDCMLGRYASADRVGRDSLGALSLLKSNGNEKRDGAIRRFKINARSLLFESAIRQRLLDLAKAELDEMSSLLNDAADNSTAGMSQIRLALLEGRYSQAYTVAHRIVNDRVLMGYAEIACQAHRLYADALLGLGKSDLATEYYNKLLPDTRRRQHLSSEQSIAAARIRKIKAAMTPAQVRRLFSTQTV